MHSPAQASYAADEGMMRPPPDAALWEGASDPVTDHVLLYDSVVTSAGD